MYNKHQIFTIICDAILIYQIAQCYDIGNGSSAEPYSLVVITTMVPPLLLSLILDFDLLILFTKAALQKRSMVDSLSRRMTSLRSSLIEEPVCFKRLVILGSNFLLSCVSWRAWSTWKCVASSPSDSEMSESASFNCVSWLLTVVNALLMDLRSFLSFLALLAALLIYSHSQSRNPRSPSQESAQNNIIITRDTLSPGGQPLPSL
jgi:hypothetical protein